jgi:hypothetical protein
VIPQFVPTGTVTPGTHVVEFDGQTVPIGTVTPGTHVVEFDGQTVPIGTVTLGTQVVPLPLIVAAVAADPVADVSESTTVRVTLNVPALE